MIQIFRIFKYNFKVFQSLAEVTIHSIELSKIKESNKTRRLKHNLINHNSNIIQELYKLFSQEQFKSGANHIDIIQSTIQKDPRKAAYAFLKILKNSNLMKAEFDVYEMLDQKTPYLDITEHSIHKVVILTINPFWLDLIEKNINLNIQPCNEKINIDYKTLSVALSHIFDNATKYLMPNSEYNIHFENFEEKIVITFHMISLKVDEIELKDIFKENISGKWAIDSDLAGDGIGMYMIKKLINLNNGTVVFRPNVDENKKYNYNNKPYENNIIEISLNK